MPPAADSDIHRQLAARLTRQTFELGRATSPSAFFSALVTWGVFLFLNPDGLALVWGGLIHTAQLVRWLFIRRNERLYPSEQFAFGQPGGLAAYLLPLTLASIVWGLAPWFLLAGNDSRNLEAILIIIIFGMLAGSIPTLSTCRPAILAWLAPLSCLAAAFFVARQNSQDLIIAGLLLLFCGVMAKFALVQHRLLARGLSAQIENTVLSEKLMQQSLALENMNLERSRFFASASHDLRQPVHALALYAQVLEHDLHDHPALNTARRMSQATEAMGKLLNLMLDISKFTSGTITPTPVRIAVDEILERLLLIYERRAQAAGLRLRVHAVAAEIETDPDLLLRILSNLLDNALKFGNAQDILLSTRRHRGKIRFAVWDKGPGIAEEHREQIFAEFFQVGNPQRDGTQGFGLGLAIVKRLAGLLGSQPGLISRPGKGSVFWIDVPVAASAPRPTQATIPPNQEVRRQFPELRLLLLDDDAMVCQAMQQWLSPRVGEIHAVQDFATAKAYVATHSRQLSALLVDYRLADDINGLEALIHLRQIAGRPIPAFIITGDTERIAELPRDTANVYVLAKPVVPAELLAHLEHLADVCR